MGREILILVLSATHVLSIEMDDRLTQQGICDH